MARLTARSPVIVFFIIFNTLYIPEADSTRLCHSMPRSCLTTHGRTVVKIVLRPPTGVPIEHPSGSGPDAGLTSKTPIEGAIQRVGQIFSRFARGVGRAPRRVCRTSGVRTKISLGEIACRFRAAGELTSNQRSRKSYALRFRREPSSLRVPAPDTQPGEPAPGKAEGGSSRRTSVRC